MAVLFGWPFGRRGSDPPRPPGVCRAGTPHTLGSGVAAPALRGPGHTCTLRCVRVRDSGLSPDGAPVSRAPPWRPSRLPPRTGTPCGTRSLRQSGGSPDSGSAWS